MDINKAEREQPKQTPTEASKAFLKGLAKNVDGFLNKVNLLATGRIGTYVLEGAVFLLGASLMTGEIKLLGSLSAGVASGIITLKVFKPPKQGR